MAKSTKDSQEEKIDLRSVNHTPKKSFRLLVFKNLFKKQSNPLRDNEGKFVARTAIGSGGLKKLRSFNLKRAIPLVAVIAFVGGIFVFQSFASSGDAAYVRNLYYICLGRPPEPGGVEGWLGEIKKGKHNQNSILVYFAQQSTNACTHPSEAELSTKKQQPAATPAPTPPSTALSPEVVSGTTTANVDIAKQWYNSCTNGSKRAVGTQPVWEAWARIISKDGQAKAWENFKNTFEKGNAGYKCALSNPVGGSTVAQPATGDPLKESQNFVVLGTAFVSQAQAANKETYAISLKNLIERYELSTIANREGYVRGTISQMQTGKMKAQGWYNTAISNTATKSQGPAILQAVNDIQGHINSLSAYAGNIANDYKRAEATYHTNLNFFGKLADQRRQNADCMARGGAPKWLGGCIEPPKPATTSGGGASGAAAPTSGGSGGNSSGIDLRPLITGINGSDKAGKNECISKPAIWVPVSGARYKKQKVVYYWDNGCRYKNSGGPVTDHAAIDKDKRECNNTPKFVWGAKDIWVWSGGHFGLSSGYRPHVQYRYKEWSNELLTCLTKTSGWIQKME